MLSYFNQRIVKITVATTGYASKKYSLSQRLKCTALFTMVRRQTVAGKRKENGERTSLAEMVLALLPPHSLHITSS